MGGKSSAYEEKTIAARGTGSFNFTVPVTARAAIQLTKIDGAATTESVYLETSNYDYLIPPSSGSNIYWCPENSFSGSLFTASAPASVMFELDNINSYYGRLVVQSKTGGLFRVKVQGKD